jgi:3-methyl-2-oxobutanoate hydroxymethyltransferase
MKTKITIADLFEARRQGRKIAAVSCYDYTTSRLVAQAGADMILVGDSAAQVILGYDSTLPVTMDFLVALTAGVRRGAPGVCLVADMPFLSYHTGVHEAVKNAGRFFVESGAEIVKIEATAADLGVIKAISDAGMAVMAHIGIRPQSVAQMGRLKAEGTTAATAVELMTLAQQMVDAGAKMLLLEGVATEVARLITEQSAVPVISCGSGAYCDGQILIIADILGLTAGPRPKFAKSFGDLSKATIDAVGKYVKEVRDGTLADDEHSYHLKSGQQEQLAKMLADLPRNE